MSIFDRLSTPSAKPSRAAVYAAFLVLLAAISCGYAITGNLRSAWRGVGVASMAPAFADLRSVTHAIDCVEQGRDPYVDWGCDPWVRPYNLPPVWLAFGKLGIDSTWTNILGFALILSVFVAFGLMLATRTWLTAILAFLAMLSPAVLLGMERGNVDLALFTLLVFGVYLGSRLRPLVQVPLMGVLIASLTVLKAFPVAAVLALARTRRGWAIAVVLAIASVAAFVLAADTRLPQILANTPQTFNLSFGSGTLFFRAADMLGVPYERLFPFRLVGSLLAAGLGLAIFFLVLFGRLDRVIEALPRVKLGHAADDLGIACAAMFCFVFLLGSSWIYRLIFLLGVLPLALRAYDESLDRKDAILPAMIVTFLWVSRVPLFWPLAEVLNWALFAALVALVASATRVTGSGAFVKALPARDDA